MKRIAGYTLFWISVGNADSLTDCQIHYWNVLLIFALLLIEYNLAKGLKKDCALGNL